MASSEAHRNVSPSWRSPKGPLGGQSLHFERVTPQGKQVIVRETVEIVLGRPLEPAEVEGMKTGDSTIIPGIKYSIERIGNLIFERFESKERKAQVSIVPETYDASVIVDFSPKEHPFLQS